LYLRDGPTVSSCARQHAKGQNVPDDVAAEYRTSGAACRQKADEAEEVAGKAYWLEIAEIWVKLARQAEQTMQGYPMLDRRSASPPR
jgi:hypothetical protein